MNLEVYDPSICILGLGLSSYTEKEIRKLSQVEVKEDVSYDSLENAVERGLVDRSLGVKEKERRCEKCELAYTSAVGGMFCPGHFGHVDLVFPVFNPVTFDVMFKWLKVCCMGCFRLLKPQSHSSLFLKQMEALDHGLITTCGDLRLIYSEMLDKGKEAFDKGYLSELVGRLDDCLKSALSSVNNDTDSPEVAKHTRQVMAIRQQLCKDILFGKPKKCPHCNRGTIPFRAEASAKLFYGKPSRGQKAQQKRTLLQRKRQKVSELETEDHESDKDYQDDCVGGEQLMFPVTAMDFLRRIWNNEKDVMSRVCGSFLFSDSSTADATWPTDTFFIKLLLVSPTRIRPSAKMKGSLIDHVLTMNIKYVVRANLHLKELVKKWHLDQKSDAAVSQVMSTITEGNSTLITEISEAWTHLQIRVNACFDTKLGRIFAESKCGLKQILDRKAGALRKNMMGKRVNCAARSVISPDPYLDTNEIGLSETFAKRLQFPESVNEKNVAELQQMVINGPKKYPGAEKIVFDNGLPKSLNQMTVAERQAMAKQLLTPTPGHRFTNKTVYRHVKNGDILILNRQPTLHRPSMQAFKARVLPSENTIRINYSACKAFNADFDGDEMNAHLPQDYLSQAEGEIFVATEHQYLVPKDGSPIAGLIQDHMIGGVLLTIRGQFFVKEDYHKLVFCGLKNFRGRIKLLPPSIIRPCCLWSGKQVLSTLLLNLIPNGKKALTVEGKAKIDNKDFLNVKQSKKQERKSAGVEFEFMSESKLVIRDGQLLVGVLDKSAYGATAYGLVHCFYELYGAEMTSSLLTCLARLFIMFLHNHSSFTMDIGDVLVTKEGQQKWKKERRRCRESNLEIFRHAYDLPNATEDEIVNAAEASHFSDSSSIGQIDDAIKEKLTGFQNSINNSCWTENLWKKFPKNGLHLMVTSGAKGNTVNCTQMICLLGQVDLESGRPPMQISGQTLPVLPPYAPSVHAGGFIENRFLSGINLREYFFHHMAGREGLVDTAVKTSRSGYLQRCLVKHLEALKIGYDMTVRDADGTIIQFLYGEDGIDVTKAPFLREKSFSFIIENKDALKPEEYRETDTRIINKYNDNLKKWWQKFGRHVSGGIQTSPFLVFCQKRWKKIMETVISEADESAMETDTENKGLLLEKTCKQNLIEEWRLLPERKVQRFIKKSRPCPNPLTDHFFPMSNFGSISEKLQLAIDAFVASESNQRLFGKKIINGKPDPKAISEEEFKHLMYEKYQSSLAVPGECVGVLAATSIGEQTTQMTLNTFHFAGHGAMNVTLGVPRLREILMTACKTIKTPITMVPLLEANERAEKKAKKISQQFKKVALSEVVSQVCVMNYKTRDCDTNYDVYIKLVDRKVCKEEFDLKPTEILGQIEQKFSAQLKSTLTKLANTLKRDMIQQESDRPPHRRRARGGDADDGDEPEGRQQRSDDENNDDNDSESSISSLDERDKEAEEFQVDQEKDNDEEEEGDEEIDKEDAGKDKNEDIAEDTEEVDKPNKLRSENEEEEDDEEYKGEEEEEEVEEQERKEQKADKELNVEADNKKSTNSYTFLSNLKNFHPTYSRGADNMSCYFTLMIALGSELECDLASIITRILQKIFVTVSRGQLKSCIAKKIEDKDSPPWMFNGRFSKDGKERQKLQFQGIDFQALYKLQDLVDVNDIYTNDIHAMAKTYGIEAARVVLINEIRSVFRVYSIDVDYRHLSLLADYMTSSGSYRAFNRMEMGTNPFVLHKASFETATACLKNAISEGIFDYIEPPSSQLIVGRPISTGTGSFDVALPTEFS